jgi:kumamolisin
MATGSGTFPLAGSERPRPDHHRHIGRLDSETLVGVTVVVRPRPGSPPLPDLVAWRAKPLRQRRVMSRDEYAARHGADPADLQSVENYARAHSLNVAEVHPGRRMVVLTGKPAEFEAAFGVSLRNTERLCREAGEDPGSRRPPAASAVRPIATTVTTGRSCCPRS